MSRWLSVVGCVLTVLLVSCQARPAKNTGFLSNHLQLEEGESFQRSWVAAGVNWKRYDTIVVAPVDVLHLEDLNYYQKKSFANYDDSGVFPEFRKDGNKRFAIELAGHFQRSLESAFTNSPDNRVRVSRVRQPKTLQLEVAIVELVPVKKLLLALGMLGDGSVNGASIAIEGRIRDTDTGQVIAMFADRKVKRFPNPRLGQKDKWSWYPQAKPAIKEWCDLLVELANQKMSPAVSNRDDLEK